MPEPETKLELEPAGTIPVIGDFVVCFGDSAWRVIGKPYKVVDENENDVKTAENEYWERHRFTTGDIMTHPQLAGIDMPRVYRVVKRGNYTTPKTLADLKVGDAVTRMLGGVVPQDLEITSIEDGVIYCGPWMFHQFNGAEIDKELGWDGINVTGSTIKPKKGEG